MYTLQNVSFQYETTRILNNINLTLSPTDHVACIGPSGSGKSTLLHLLAGLITPSSGVLAYKGKPIKAPIDNISVLLQIHSLFPWKTVRENIELPLKLKSKRENSLSHTQSARALQSNLLLKQLGLSGQEDKMPHQLSGGQQQRVALGRALITNPEMILLDEPFSALDEITREQMQDLIHHMSATYQTGYVLITHSLQEALYLGEKILLLSGKQENQSISIYKNPFFGKHYDDLSDENMVSYTKLHRELHSALKGQIIQNLGGESHD